MTTNHKRIRRQTSQECLFRLKNTKDLIHRFITTDKYLIQHHNPELKQQSTMNAE